MGRIATGSVQSKWHSWEPFPTPLTSNGLGLFSYDGLWPFLTAKLATSLAHLSPQRFPTDPGSMMIDGLPSVSLVAMGYEGDPPKKLALPVDRVVGGGVGGVGMSGAEML